MNRRDFLLLGATAVTAAGQTQPSPKLNILLITADDLGAPEVSAYGERKITTARIDQLASEGVRFETGWVAQASCSPSRSAMFTGCYPHSNGQYGLVNTGFALHPEYQQKTIPAVLKKGGYRTGIIGKLHVAPEENFPFDFRDLNNNDTRTPLKVEQKVKRFWDEQPANQPFFLMMNISDPHAFRNPDAKGGWDFPPQVDGEPKDPLPPSERTVFPFQQTDTPEQRVRTAGYYNAIQRLDISVGKILDELKRRQYEQNTLVIFVGDHGPPFARSKTSCYEAALHVPYLVRWPGVSKPRVSKALVSTVDLAPTIYDAAGVTAPAGLHGRSLRPVIVSERAPWRRVLGGEFHFHGSAPFYPRRAVRDLEGHKLIHNVLAGKAKPSTGIDGDAAYQISRETRYDGTPVRKAFDTFANPPEFELYDLRKDPVEFYNLAADPAHAKTLERLKRELLAWRKETQDPFLDPGFLETMIRTGAPAARQKK